MQKARYELDPYNRMTIANSDKKSGLSKPRRVLDGRFKLDANNNLSYHITSPLSDGGGIPNELKLKGQWSLTAGHRLTLTLDKSARQTFGDRIILQGDILDAGGSSLLFAVTTTTNKGARTTYVLNFGGVWKADDRNRLSFHIKRESGKHDVLTFEGAWQINKDHEVLYHYEKARLLRKKREFHTLTFKGHWNIWGPLNISYLLSGGSDSVFMFKTAAAIFRKNSIEYELAIGLSRKVKPSKQSITLSGAWRPKRDLGLVFEIEYENGKAKAMVFGADARLTGNNTVSFKIGSDAQKKDVGASIELAHAMIAGDGEAFLRGLASGRELAIYAGAACRW